MREPVQGDDHAPARLSRPWDAGCTDLSEEQIARMVAGLQSGEDEAASAKDTLLSLRGRLDLVLAQVREMPETPARNTVIAQAEECAAAGPGVPSARTLRALALALHAAEVHLSAAAPPAGREEGVPPGAG
ncbi:hypothetical protein GCM10010371_63690 [Streptomyces subrutilus]|uniref:Uncharacterized protein n=1 Tax=Streptomyces subrutilus TaxID=36818 RepID=A0A918RCP6_9ACTN|nr:hypothetical protein [Streptomyces subrutilus]GGZ95061.1 hypothetical protein GCM10010371_63690 [Streptomyces subrutilus]